MPTFPDSPTTVPKVLLAKVADDEFECDLHSFMRGELLLPHVDVVEEVNALVSITAFRIREMNVGIPLSLHASFPNNLFVMSH